MSTMNEQAEAALERRPVSILLKSRISHTLLGCAKGFRPLEVEQSVAMAEQGRGAIKGAAARVPSR